MDGKEKSVGGAVFRSYGASVDVHPAVSRAYLTAACALGMRETDMNGFLSKLHKALSKLPTKKEVITHLAIVESADGGEGPGSGGESSSESGEKKTKKKKESAEAEEETSVESTNNKADA